MTTTSPETTLPPKMPSQAASCESKTFAEPDNATYLDTYAWIFFKQGNYSLARIYLQNALDKTKEPSAELFEHYGDILFMLGEVDEAVTYWQKALEAGSESAELLQKKIKNKKYIEK